MKKGLAEIVCIIDRSGSMSSIKKDAIGGFNTFIEEQKKVEGEAKATLILFDHEYKEVYAGKALDSVEPLNEETYVPRGTTALLDAIGRTVVTVGERLAELHESDKPEKVIICIITDGWENASREYSRDKVASMVKQQQDDYSWDFIFTAANIDAVAASASLNIPAGNTYCFDATSAGTNANYRSINTAVTSMRTDK